MHICIPVSLSSVQKTSISQSFFEAFDPFAFGLCIVRPQAKTVAAPGADVPPRERVSPRKMTFLAREYLELVDGVAELVCAAEFADDFRHILPARSLKLPSSRCFRLRLTSPRQE